MKKLRNLALAIIGLLALLLLANYGLNASQSGSSSQVINFYNWGDYIDPEVLKAFEEETGYKVVYETFDSNEGMLTKVKQGGTTYDLIVPSEYMVEVMKEDGLLHPLQHDLLPNVKHVDPYFLDQSFDPKNEYSLPYFWGTLGIVYNTQFIEEGEIEDWEDLWRPEYYHKILMIDGAREVIGIGLQSEGHSLNETDSTLLLEAAEKMKTLMPNIMALVTDEIKMYLVNGEAPLAVTYSGEAAMAMEGNEDLLYVVPESGSNLWFDTLAIPTTATNIEGAHALIDYLMRPEVAAQNAEYIGYATPNKDALPLIDPEMVNDKSMYPDIEQMQHLEVYRNLGQRTLIEYNDLYLEVKIDPNK